MPRTRTAFGRKKSPKIHFAAASQPAPHPAGAPLAEGAEPAEPALVLPQSLGQYTKPQEPEEPEEPASSPSRVDEAPDAVSPSTPERKLLKNAERELKDAQTQFLFFPVNLEKLERAIESARAAGVEAELLTEAASKLERERLAAKKPEADKQAEKEKLPDTPTGEKKKILDEAEEQAAKRLKAEKDPALEREERELRAAIDPGWFIPRDPERMRKALDSARTAGVDEVSSAALQPPLASAALQPPFSRSPRL